MKKLALALLVGSFCFGATNTFAQTKKETAQEKILRLEVENRVLNEYITRLTQQITSLQAQLTAAQDQPATTASSVQNTPAQNAPTLKLYYANMKVQQMCEKYPKCAQLMATEYEGRTLRQTNFQVLKAEEAPAYIGAGLFHSGNKTCYDLYLYTNLDPHQPIIFTRETDGNSWLEYLWYPNHLKLDSSRARFH